MTQLKLKGLSAPASIHVDPWGMAHIRAASAMDAFFLQGFNAARDRLWQIDLWRKRGLGLLAADFGPGYLMQDRAARLFLYRGDMAAEWTAYGTDAEEICTAFAAGVNAGMQATLDGDLPMPPEFTALGTLPAFWAPEDVVRIRTHCLTRNAASELARARVHALADPETDLLRVPLCPPVPDAEWANTQGADLPAEALAVFELATAPVTLSPERLNASLDEAEAWSAVDAAKTVIRTAVPMEGSNNWVVGPELTKSGRPIMASDPHRLHSAPSLRYMVHLSAPGLDVIGAGEPSSPGIMAGHNGTSAFSLTIFCADQEDVVVCDLVDTDRYVYGSGTREIVRLEEVFAVKGAPDQTLTLEFTHHGPVVWRSPDGGRAVSVRTVFTEAGTAPYMCSLKAMRTTSMEDFRQSVHTWGAPSVNLVYADTAGDFCWQPAGFVPRRGGWRGLSPVAGDGRFEWAGFMTAADLPALCNPEKGFVHSANEMNLPEGWDHDAHPVGYEWFEDGRADRIAARIADGQVADVAGSCALQCDTYSDLAMRLVALIPAAAAETARRLLVEWDGFASPDSAAALVFELWFSSHVRPGLADRVADTPALRAYLAVPNAVTTVRLFEGTHPGLARRAGLEDAGQRGAFLAETLQAACDDALRRFGPNPNAWRWGDLHKGYFAHAVSKVAPGHDVGPVDKGGTGTTVMLANYDPVSYRVTHGASVRMVVDVGDWDKSVWINAPGQSGLPGSPHHADLMPLWAAGEYVPMLYSAEAIDQSAASVIHVAPA
ncbi:penicillin acylase family protein [Marimonas sp. MJW-29]|uniref:Penicillin acylase family protein n=1 Tax=Sulfitobacter sediminis TaxID=3234186 RepID=A0ABV3RPE7_9RHOB